MLEIFNISKNKKICDARVAKGFLDRALGLMFRKELPRDAGLLIELTMGRTIHSFFMRFPIELIFINEHFKICELASLNPWKVYIPKEKAKWVLEVNKGVIKEKDIEIGDKVSFK